MPIIETDEDAFFRKEDFVNKLPKPMGKNEGRYQNTISINIQCINFLVP